MNYKLLNLMLIGILIFSIINSSCSKSSYEPDYSKESGVFTDNRDNKTYKWVKIGEQIWMAENLAFKVDTGGCWAYENSTGYVETFGYLYDWWTAKAAAPIGWHLPTDDEFVQLMEYLRGNGYSYTGVVGNSGIGKSLASDNGWDISENEGAVGNSDYPDYRNKTGFSALPSGYRGLNGSFCCLGSHAKWWMDAEIDYSNSYSYYRYLSSDNSGLIRLEDNKMLGYAVRCVKN